jgi:hypothetical protein
VRLRRRKFLIGRQFVIAESFGLVLRQATPAILIEGAQGIL